ncbi:hypothetical protein D4764_02G0004870 [Takifugu flavidus]|uniref:Uncharacterized protein n=1 Tax=Takifugu flavidus TaxID=433684 RepID=A0A5C6NJZ3_9TELE|nr:hypothetical protein D4764_02G0004870 [Takifugu flavidus]
MARLCAAWSTLQQLGQKDILAGSQGGCIAYTRCSRQLPEVFVVNH